MTNEKIFLVKPIEAKYLKQEWYNEIFIGKPLELTKGEKNDIMSCGRLCEVGSKELVTMKIRKSWLKKLEGLK